MAHCRGGISISQLLIIRPEVRDISFNKQKLILLSTMKAFIAGFLLLVLVASTLGKALPSPVQENAHPFQENAHGQGKHHSCLAQYISCLRNDCAAGTSRSYG